MKTPQEAAREYAHDHIAERCKSTNCKEFDCRKAKNNKNHAKYTFQRQAPR